jgi:hypothetical protein
LPEPTTMTSRIILAGMKDDLVASRQIWRAAAFCITAPTEPCQPRCTKIGIPIEF